MRRQTTILVSVTLALVLVGILMVYSTSTIKAPSGKLFKVQLAYAALGVAAMFLVAHIDYHHLCAPGIYRPIVALAFILLVLVLIPGIGVEAHGAQRWLRLHHFHFQPSEFAKLAIIILLAAKLTENQDQVRSFKRGFLPPVASAGCFALLVLLERDLGMPAVIMAVAFLMVFVAGARLGHVLAGAASVALAMVVLSITSPERLRRLFAFHDPWRYRDDESFQLIQSLSAFARGAIWGQGPGASEQKLFYLPAAHTDFIFAIWAEEMGLVGSLALVALYVILLVVAVRVATCARDLLGALLATGIVSVISLQAAFIMAVTTGLLPTKGLPLPFVSYGGTALLVFLTLMGILLNIGRQAQEPNEEREPSAFRVLKS